MRVWKPLTLSVALACSLYGLSNSGVAAASNKDDAMARIAQHRDHGQWLDALTEIERLQEQFPQDDFLYQLHVLTLSDIGNAGRAWQLYQARPQLFDAEQRRHLETNYLSKRVGWSLAYGKSEDTRLDEAEAALAQMHALLEQDGLSIDNAPLRVRFDRLVLLNRLARHVQVRDEYRALTQQGHALPDYVLPAVGDSLMATQHPEEAIPLLQAASRSEPERDDVRTELAYAYLESGQPRQAIDFLKQWREEEPPFRRQAGAKQSYQNWAHYEADLNLAMIRAYSGDLPTAQRALEDLADAAPGNGGLHSSLGMIYQMRGWPRRALERQQMAYTQDPREVQPRVGQFEAYVDLQRDDLARPLYEDLLRRYPTQPVVQRMQRSWNWHRGWQAHAYAQGGHSSGSGVSPLGNDDRRYGVELLSPILDDRWRLLAFADRRSVDYPERQLRPLRVGGGVQYRYDQLDGQLLLNNTSDDIGGVGIRAGMGWQFNDHWHIGLTAARNDEEASMQARAADIDADSMALALEYRHSERTRWTAGASRFHYADGNNRDLLSSGIEQRVLTQPKLQVTALGNAYLGRSSRHDVPYFNPERDGQLELGLRLDHQTWQRYERHFNQQLEVSVGNYWQRDYGNALVPTVSYRHEWQLGIGKVIEYGVSWSRPVYDGRRERHIGMDAAIHWGQ
ncbi:poly-beta-1,6 N-acetyl-D-glucosamine export porin PgaA [Stenotrophomonas sp. Iso1]|uniref:poly-beta-1,6 N-acetyl-D-glucosamine export porin PgaA n=1 Tax=Stenotrophomonas sp. Iso1 TaxID=2977283 RepID=UPI002FCCEFCA